VQKRKPKSKQLSLFGRAKKAAKKVVNKVRGKKAAPKRSQLAVAKSSLEKSLKGIPAQQKQKIKAALKRVQERTPCRIKKK
jgi:hypothetical protein